MTDTEEIDRLKGRLKWESGGPMAALTNRATDTLLARGGEFASWVREMGEERPLISLLVAFQLGFAVGRWGPHRAKH